MFTIGQFSRICNVSPKALRHYEKIGLLVPARVVEENQYRYYSREQAETMRKITFLKNLGLPLKTISSIMADSSSPGELGPILTEHRQLLVDTINDCNNKLFKLTNWEKYQEAKEMEPKKNYPVNIQAVPEISVLSKRTVSTNFPADIRPLFAEIAGEMMEKQILCAGAPMIIYYDEEFNPQKVDFEMAFPVSDSKFASKILPACVAATCTHVGPYDELPGVYEPLFAWINSSSYRAAGPIREVYPNDPCHTPPADLVTHIFVPVEKK